MKSSSLAAEPKFLIDSTIYGLCVNPWRYLVQSAPDLELFKSDTIIYTVSISFHSTHCVSNSLTIAASSLSTALHPYKWFSNNLANKLSTNHSAPEMYACEFITRREIPLRANAILEVAYAFVRIQSSGSNFYVI